MRPNRDRRFVIALTMGGNKCIPGSKVAPNPGGVNSQVVSIPYTGADEQVGWTGESKDTVPVLVVRRVGRHTARITDLEGDPYSLPMRTDDAIRMLREVLT